MIKRIVLFKAFLLVSLSPTFPLHQTSCYVKYLFIYLNSISLSLNSTNISPQIYLHLISIRKRKLYSRGNNSPEFSRARQRQLYICHLHGIYHMFCFCHVNLHHPIYMLLSLSSFDFHIYFHI